MFETTINASHIKNAHLLTPADSGLRDLLVLGPFIFRIGPPGSINATSFDSLATFDAEGDYLMPGFIDGHVHFLGGGGEGGPHTRTPEVTLSTLTTAGITAAAGVLGTDSITRTLPALLAKARGLQQDGLTTRIYTGAYSLPTPTLTESVTTDLVLIDQVVGAKTAISDHRASHSDLSDLKALASACRMGGLLGGKPGQLHLHVGSGKDGLDPVFRIIEETEIPSHLLYPTHVGRTPELLRSAARLTQFGATIDLTAGPDAADAVDALIGWDTDLARVTLSSDANGSLPRFDENGDLIGLVAASPKSLLNTLRELAADHPLSTILPLVTENPARQLGLNEGQGQIVRGAVADLLCVERNTFKVRHLWCRGKHMIREGKILKRGTFENNAPVT